MSDKSTPRPWGIDKPFDEPGIYIQGKDTSLVCKMSEVTGMPMANARLIVRAVNAFEAMGNALRVGLGWSLSDGEPDDSRLVTDSEREFRLLARAALALADLTDKDGV
jgi:hypothetical protein